MAPNTALCFTLAGAVLWVMSVSSARREQILMFTGPLGSIVLALGLVAALGYVTGLKTYSWGYFTNMAAHTAVGCSMLGGGLIAFAWQVGANEQATAPQRFALLVGICGLTVTLCLWQALIAHERALVERTIERQCQCAKRDYVPDQTARPIIGAYGQELGDMGQTGPGGMGG
jgi:hypothetical protein